MKIGFVWRRNSTMWLLTFCEPMCLMGEKGYSANEQFSGNYCKERFEGIKG